MTRQKTVTLNLTKSEAECLLLVYEAFTKQYDVNNKAVRPLHPFMGRLLTKIRLANSNISKNKL